MIKSSEGFFIALEMVENPALVVVGVGVGGVELGDLLIGGEGLGIVAKVEQGFGCFQPLLKGSFLV